MRGKVTLQDVPCDSVGITPACAGKRKKCRKCRPGLGDHPRMCGEKKFTFDAGKLIPGSPPRMRGKAAGHRLGLILNRITPAYAGKSRRCCPPGFPHWDHPRVCGEKRSARSTTCGSWGSPPRMRGKAVCFVGCWFAHGITPACAGKSFLVNLAAQPRGDHPPRMRGKEEIKTGKSRRVGITPAYAGKRRKAS